MQPSTVTNNFKRQNHATFFNGDSSAVDRSGAGLPQLEEQELKVHVEAGQAETEITEESVDSILATPVGTVSPADRVADHTNADVVTNTFGTYVVPIASTDYEGLEKLDPRLADRIWRLNNLYWVVDEDGNLMQFKLRPAQMYLLENMHYKNIILKARQLGFTTFICIFMLDYALFNRNKSLGIVAHTKDDASVIFRKVKIAWDNFPVHLKEYFKLTTTGDSATEYQFTNGSVMRVSTSLRSGTYQMVLITEFGKICSRFPEKAAEIVTGTLPAVPAGGVVFIESTAEGEEGHFYEYCQDAMEMKRLKRALTRKDYKFFFFPWYENPADVIEGDVQISAEVDQYLEKMQRLVKVTFTREQKNWYYLTTKELKSKMKQEHPTTPEEAFLTSGNKLFKGEMVDAQREKYMCEPIEVDGDFLIYKRFVSSHLYGLGADVSQGGKRDSSTIVVIDFTTGEVVLTYRSNEIDPVLFAHDIKKAALMYGGCIAAPEANNVGMTTCVTLNGIYSNIYTQVREGLLEAVPSSKLGYLTSSLTKPKYMYELSEAMENDDLKIPDEGILLEAKKFNKEDTLEITVTENTTRHFDLLIATGIAFQMRGNLTRGKADPEDVAEVENRRERVRTQGRKAYR